MPLRLLSLANIKGSQLDAVKRTMVLLLVLFQALTVISILFFSRMTNEAVLLELAQKSLNNATNESIRHTEAFLDSAARAVTSGAKMYTREVLTTADIARTEGYFINQLDHNAEFAGMYLGTVAGDFVYVSRELEVEKGKYRVKHVDIREGEAYTQLWWRDSSNDRRGLLHDPDDVFDPRTRPWFERSVAEGGLIWTNPYIFFTAQRLGITAAVPVQSASGETLGVIGVDLELESLAHFLRELNISDSGSAFIANQEGLLIASPHLLARAEAADRENERITSNIAEDPVASEALRTIQEGGRALGPTRATFTIGEREYLSDFVPLPLPGGSQWLIGTYAAENDFLGAIRSNERRNMVLALGLLLASMLIGWFLARSIWTPVEALHSQANRDQLTQAFNRHFLARFAHRGFEKARRNEETISVAIVDIDHFKSINDRHGHEVGDTVIKALAGRLQAGSRAADIVARFGGEEFVIVLPEADVDETIRALERIRLELEEHPIETSVGSLPITFSAGVCELTDELTTYEQVLRAADKALYAAKHTGRDKVVRFDDAHRKNSPSFS